MIKYRRFNQRLYFLTFLKKFPERKFTQKTRKLQGLFLCFHENYRGYYRTRFSV